MTADDEPAAAGGTAPTAAEVGAAPAPTTTTATTTATNRTSTAPATTVATPATPLATARVGTWLLHLRGRLILALLAAVVVAVGAGTVAHLVEVSARLERDLAAQGGRVTGAIRTDLEQTATALDEELGSAADPRAGVARLLSSGRVEDRFLGAHARLTMGRLEVLKILQRDGTILTSGHWPASFGALDPLIAAYVATGGRLPRIVDEATPQGSAPALERWAVLRSGGREVLVVAGRFLDGSALERLRARTGADLLALCPAAPPARRGAESPECLSVRTPELLPDRAFRADDDAFAARLRLDVFDVGGFRLFIGLDRSGIDTVRRGIVVRAVVVGVLAVVFAVVLGAALAARIVRPIESLADAARALAGGDLSTRVPPGHETGEVRELVDAFNRMAADLEQGQRRLLQAERVAAWQEIARGLAHELKNPLTPILSAMTVVRRARELQRADFDAILTEQSKAVVEEVMRLKELADAFARFARLPEQRPEPLRLDDLVDQVLALYVPADLVAVDRGWPTGDARLPEVVADKNQLQTALANLVKNAVEAMETLEPGAARLRAGLAVVASAAGGVVELTIDDSGPGIAPEVAGRLFTPYVTTKGSRGTGLGLALVHRIVAEHGGSIEAGRSPVLAGARFAVRLPLRPPPTPTEQGSMPSAPSVSTTP
ncbi:MAG: HAMP domain-containing protein [Deltaproteobacteria bacterium]|nr:HAMP domain-containing protein [Deltaproteobacteria bacterium]